MSRTKSAVRTTTLPARKTGGRSRGTAAAVDKSRKPVEPNSPQAEWEDVPDEHLDVIPDIDGLLDRPAANRNTENEARRRIEKLREERLLQQALSDVFDL